MKHNVAERRRRGRPPKFGRPSQLVALTLPIDVVRGLQRVDKDIARAIVRVFEGTVPAGDDSPRDRRPDAELVRIADRRSLIVVNSAVIQSLPGVNVVPLDATRAFLALEPGRGVSDLELAVIDRLDDAVETRERQALGQLRRQLKAWRRDAALRFHSRSIIVVETLAPSRMRADSTPRDPTSRRRGTYRMTARPASHGTGPLQRSVH
jgi:hypothetical protein